MIEVITNDAFWDDFFLGTDNRVFLKNWVTNPIIYRHVVVGDPFSMGAGSANLLGGGASAWIS